MAGNKLMTTKSDNRIPCCFSTEIRARVLNLRRKLKTAIKPFAPKGELWRISAFRESDELARASPGAPLKWIIERGSKRRIKRVLRTTLSRPTLRPRFCRPAKPRRELARERQERPIRPAPSDE